MANIDIGCGEVKRGDIGIDITLTDSTDIVCSVYDLPFKSESFDEALFYRNFGKSERVDNK